MAGHVAHFHDDRPKLADKEPLLKGPAAGGAALRLRLDHTGDPPPEPADRSGLPPRGSADGLEVNGTDGRLSACLGDVKPCGGPGWSAAAEEAADGIRSAVAGSYGSVMPVDWNECGGSFLSVSTFDLEGGPREIHAASELSEEEELWEQLDKSSFIFPCLEEEPLVTAEQVIEEIEEMMQDSPDTQAESNPSQSDQSMLSPDVQRGSGGFLGRLVVQSVVELSERLREAETNIRRFSEQLVQQLAIRDELEFEKEVKNTFISALLDVQNRQKEQRESLRKKKKVKGGAALAQAPTEKTPGSRFSMEGLSSVIQNSFRQTFGSACSERQYLTTVIPYEKKDQPPSVEDLQILTKILHAMRDDSDKVPGLLTDYILNVFCPT